MAAPKPMTPAKAPKPMTPAKAAKPMTPAKAAKPMTPAKAAKVWTETKRALDELEPKLKAAAEVLKPHFRQLGKDTYRGVRYAHSTFRSVDQAQLVNRFGAEAVDQCKVLRDRETLSLAKR